MVDDLDKLLAERKRQHGNFYDHAVLTQSFKEIAWCSHNWKRLSATQREGIEMILHKLGRILAGDPNHIDHWDDIAGYARITKECIPAPIVITNPDPPST